LLRVLLLLRNQARGFHQLRMDANFFRDHLGTVGQLDVAIDRNGMN
jgi:hypothetical protein